LQGTGDLRHGVCGVVQQHGLYLWAQARQQGAEVIDLAVDEDDFWGVGGAAFCCAYRFCVCYFNAPWVLLDAV
jgi:hypothetical protein